MKSTFHNSVVNVPPATNPTPMSKSDRCVVKTTKIKTWLKSIFSTILELALLETLVQPPTEIRTCSRTWQFIRLIGLRPSRSWSSGPWPWEMAKLLGSLPQAGSRPSKYRKIYRMGKIQQLYTQMYVYMCIYIYVFTYIYIYLILVSRLTSPDI